MTLTAKHRSSLYRSLSPLVGDEEAEALLAQFPGREGEELVTKDFLDAQIAGLRTDIAHLEMRMNDKFRQQTIWMSSLCLTAMTVLVGIVALLS